MGFSATCSIRYGKYSQTETQNGDVPNILTVQQQVRRDITSGRLHFVCNRI